MKTLLVDMDSIFADLISAWVEEYNQLAGTNHTIEDAKSWDLAKAINGDPKIAYGIFDRPGFFRNLKPIPGAIETLRSLKNKGHRLVIATAHSVYAPHSAAEKVAWLHDYMPWIIHKDVMIGHAKELLRADALIDDGPHNLTKYRAAWPLARLITIGYPYNEEFRGKIDLYADGYKDFTGAWAQIEAFIDQWEAAEKKIEEIKEQVIAQGTPILPV
jgi:5'(3')-deoxyribonucleotidase